MGNNQMFLENGNTDTLILNDTAFSADTAIEKHNVDPQAHPYILEQLSAKQDTLTAGTGISIVGNEISCTQASAEWGNITGTLSEQTDLQEALDEKQATLSGAQLNAVNSD